MQETNTYNFLRLVLDTMPASIVVREADSRIVYANRAHAESYGKTVEDLLGRLDAEYWAMLGRPPEQIEHWLAEDREVLRTGTGQEYVQEIIRGNGERGYFHNFKECLSLPDGRRYLLAQYADITERQRFEHWLAKEESVAAELAGIRKTTVTYAHEINNPLTGIIGFVQLSQEHEDCTPELHEMLDQIEVAAQRISGVIRAMQAVEQPRTREYLGRNVMLDLRSDSANDAPAPPAEHEDEAGPR